MKKNKSVKDWNGFYDSELGLIESEEDLEKALTFQFKAHGMTDEEIKQWFEEVDKEEE